MGNTPGGQFERLPGETDETREASTRTIQIWLHFLNIQYQGENKACNGKILGFEIREAWVAYEQIISSFN